MFTKSVVLWVKDMTLNVFKKALWLDDNKNPNLMSMDCHETVMNKKS